LQGWYANRASDLRISLSQVESGAAVESEGFLHMVTAIAIGVERSTGEPSASWHITLS
jgi:hypothetical protein